MRLRSGFQKGLTKSKSEESSKSGSRVTKRRRLETATTDEDCIQLSDSIWMFPDRRISTHGEIYEGEIRSGILEARPIVLKLVENIPQSITEARILAKLNNHSHVLSQIHTGTCNFRLVDQIYIALDKCHHENLREFVTNRKNHGFAFNLNRAIEIAGQMVDGVKYIHENRIIHKDLKPDNILFSLDQKLIKIADFGLSQEIESTSAEVFEEGQFGTNGFRPPELFGRGIISQKSDIFSLGVIFHFVLSDGEHLFGDDSDGWNYRVKNGIIDLSGLLVPNIKTSEHLIKSMIEHKTNDRPTIWQVSEHPFWTGNEVSCDFDYHCPESSMSLIPPTSEPSFDIADIDVDQLLKHVKKIELRDEAAAAKIRQRAKDGDADLTTTEVGADHEVGNDHQPSTSIQPAVIEPTSPHVTEINPNKASPNEEKADELIKHSKYEEAISLLEDLPPSKRQLTQMLECYFQLKRDSRLPKCIEMMKMLMMRHPRPKPYDVFKLGKTHLKKSSHIKALTYFSCASKLYVLDSKPDDAVLGIANCTVHCKKVIQAMVGQGDRMRVLAIDIGIGIINEMLVDIRSITHAHPDKKADCESHCLKHLGISYRRIKEPEKAIEIYKQGIEIMKRHFGSNASKYRILGLLLHNMGSANDDLGSYCEAEKLYLESLKTYELAQDYASEEVKKTFIDTAQSNLQIVRKKMKK